MRRIILSLSVIVAIAAVAAGATTAFFSDSETSSGNTFSAGAVDLKIGNESYVDQGDGLQESTSTSWGISEEGGMFFDFYDMKPGDFGEDTITLEVEDNDAWACAATDITAASENGLTDPESEVDDTPNEGELQDHIQMAVWKDDGDNVYEEGERLLKLGEGDDPFVTIDELDEQGVLALADSEYSIFADGNEGEPLTGGEEYHLAKAWCLGELEAEEVPQEEGNTPAEDGSGFTCNGTEVGNETQTDSVEADVQFYAVQARNNDDFTCDQWTPGTPDDEEITVGTGEGWPDIEKAWMTSARWGNNQDDSGDWELAIKEDGTSLPWDQDGYVWEEGEPQEFTLEYDGDEAIFSVEGEEVSHSSLDANDKIGLAAKTSEEDCPGGKVSLTDMDLDGESLPDIIAEGTDSERGLEHVIVSDADLSGGFTLTGEATFEWADGHTDDEGPAFEIHVEDN